MAHCYKADKKTVRLLIVGDKLYQADLFRDFHAEQHEDESINYYCETVRTSVAYSFETEKQAMTFFKSNFDSLFELELHNEELDLRNKDIADGHDFLDSMDYMWFKALEYSANHNKTLEEAINYIEERFPTFFQDRQKARDLINGN